MDKPTTPQISPVPSVEVAVFSEIPRRQTLRSRTPRADCSEVRRRPSNRREEVSSAAPQTHKLSSHPADCSAKPRLSRSQPVVVFSEDWGRRNSPSNNNSRLLEGACSGRNPLEEVEEGCSVSNSSRRRRSSRVVVCLVGWVRRSSLNSSNNRVCSEVLY